MFGKAAIPHRMYWTLLLALLAVTGRAEEKPVEMPPDEKVEADAKHLRTATLGGGCFWCVEAVYQNLAGVKRVVSGYAGGTTENPTYEAVCAGITGHAEVCQIVFDPEKVTYGEILEVFFKTHDPTTLNRQGNDLGTQYRSIILYHDDTQRDAAAKKKKDLDESKAFQNPIVTEIVPFKVFYEAEEKHQDFFARNPNQGYCRAVVRPKVDKFKKEFEDKIKK